MSWVTMVLQTMVYLPLVMTPRATMPPLICTFFPDRAAGVAFVRFDGHAQSLRVERQAGETWVWVMTLTAPGRAAVGPWRENYRGVTETGWVACRYFKPPFATGGLNELGVGVGGGGDGLDGDDDGGGGDRGAGGQKVGGDGSAGALLGGDDFSLSARAPNVG